MAMAMRSSVCGKLGGGFTAAPRVWCGMESAKKSRVSLRTEEDESSFAKKASSISSSASSEAAVRCQATTSTVTRQTSGDGILEREKERVSEMRTVENNRSALQGFFEAEAAVGMVECCSHGCRPIFDEQESILSIALPQQLEIRESVAEVYHRTGTPVYHGRRGGGPSQEELRIKPNIPADFVLHEAVLDKTSIKSQFETALQAAPRDLQLLSEFAVFAWRTLGDLDRAEELYNEALMVSPNDTNVLASYALFLWECDQ